MGRVSMGMVLAVMRAITARDRGDEAGQSVIEYVGMVTVAVLLVLGVLSATDAVDLGGFFTDQIDKIKNFK